MAGTASLLCTVVSIIYAKVRLKVQPASLHTGLLLRTRVHSTLHLSVIPQCTCLAPRLCIMKMTDSAGIPGTKHMRVQGAAHYLEHMLFMGNNKFKREGEFEAFLEKHGGSCNGFTEYQYICLHLEVEEDAFGAALDRFAHFFISPRLTQDALSREVSTPDRETSPVPCFTRVYQHVCTRCTALLAGSLHGSMMVHVLHHACNMTESVGPRPTSQASHAVCLHFGAAGK
jgi:hypothetical protein